MRLFILLNLALLAALSWSFAADCTRITPSDRSHFEVNLKGKHTNKLGEGLLSRLSFDFHIKELLQLNLEEYDDLEAPPALAEANHGPVLFFRPKRRRRPPGFRP
ncbi:hypothetical protein GOP47_0014689 [Adiantum capillus-veneris]|uniref:Uncharacterized protein n=1 Tax=Adiantum capillus-veneris TaxID=13818 RepID=A0A9D4ZF23_ADICA|nr:hypothetical protein GOP47_0014689 [Adiantum capillus-veneris]